MLRYVLAPVVVLFALLAPMLLFLMAMDGSDTSVETTLPADSPNGNAGDKGQPNTNEEPEGDPDTKDEEEEDLPSKENA